MEVSSHALVQARVRNVEFDVADLYQPHPGPSRFSSRRWTAYAEAKARLFAGLGEQRRKKGKAVFNLDDRIGAQFATRFAKELPVITYGLGVKADFRASNPRIDFNGASYQLDALGRSYLVRLPLIGQFNVYNSLAALAGAHVLGIDIRTAVLALADSPAVPGRLEAVPAQRQFRVFVDYAHTDDALLNVMKTLPGAEARPAHRRLWLRWQSRSQQAPAHGRRGRSTCRLRDHHERQSSQGRPVERSSRTSSPACRRGIMK